VLWRLVIWEFYEIVFVEAVVVAFGVEVFVMSLYVVLDKHSAMAA